MLSARKDKADMKPMKFLALCAMLCGVGIAQAQSACESAGDQRFVCGPRNAEDLVQVPGTPWIVSSGMADGASFFLVDSRTGAWRPLTFDVAKDQAFSQCPAPPVLANFQTHGLNIRPRRDGARLYVVGHGAREAIEIFDVGIRGAEPTLTWRGCVPMPAGLAANSVASFANGSLVATVLLMPGKSFMDSVSKKPTGAVYEWSPGDNGFKMVVGTELPGNNGIEVSADERKIFVVSSGLQTVVAFSRSNPARQLRSTRPLPFTPDNVRRGPDGRLVSAGMANDVPECGGAPGPTHDLSRLSTCPRGTIAVAIDPRTMRDTVVVQTPAAKSFSNATIVLPMAGDYWIGTFSGDRIARVAARKPARKTQAP
jgi:SMP-30/Gluconolactonase/LRE-like region